MTGAVDAMVPHWEPGHHNVVAMPAAACAYDTRKPLESEQDGGTSAQGKGYQAGGLGCEKSVLVPKSSHDIKRT